MSPASCTLLRSLLTAALASPACTRAQPARLRSTCHGPACCSHAGVCPKIELPTSACSIAAARFHRHGDTRPRRCSGCRVVESHRARVAPLPNAAALGASRVTVTCCAASCSFGQPQLSPQDLVARHGDERECIATADLSVAHPARVPSTQTPSDLLARAHRSKPEWRCLEQRSRDGSPVATGRPRSKRIR